MQKATLVILFVCSSILTWAAKPTPHSNYRVVEDLSNRWMQYSQDEGVYLPYRYNANHEFQTFSLRIDFTKYPFTYLVLKTPEKESFIFVEGKLKRASSKSEWLIYSLEQLRKELKSDTAYFSVFTSSRPKDMMVYIGYPARSQVAASSPVEIEVSNKRDAIQLLPRVVTKMHSGTALAFVLVLILTSFVSSNYVRAYNKYYSLKNVLATRVKDDLFLIGKSLDRTNLLFVILLSGLWAFLIFILLGNGVKLSDHTLLQFTGSQSSLQIQDFFVLIGIILIVYLAKLVLIWLTAALFNLSKMVDAYYYKLIQYNVFFVSLALIVALFMYNLYIPFPKKSEELLIIIFSIFLLVRVILIYFTLNRDRQVNFLYMFSYLCIVELLPILIGIRFLS